MGLWNGVGVIFPHEITITRGGTQLAAFPTIVDQQSGVGLRLTDSLAASDQQTRQGLMRLFQIINRKHIKSQVNWLPELDRHSIVLAQFISAADITNQLGDLIARVAFIEQQKIPRSESDFQERQANAVERIGIATQEVASWLPKLATELHHVQIALDDLSANFAAAKEDLTRQLAALTPVNFLVDTPWNWLKHYPRFLQAMIYRMEKLSSTDPSKDRSQTELIEAWWTRWQEADQHRKPRQLSIRNCRSFAG